MGRVTESASQSTRVEGNVFRRVSPPRWPFVFRGLLPLLGFLLVVLFGLTQFANNWIERRTRENVRAALDAAGHQWAELAVSGQQVNLSGVAPSMSEGEAALEVARGATCQTWLGPRVCAISVSGAFSGSAGDDVWPDLGGTIYDRLLTLSGVVFEENLRAGLLETARRAVRDGRVTDVVDSLEIVSRGAPEGFTAIAGRVAELASLCAEGEVGLTNKTLSVDCLANRALEPEIRGILERPLEGASLGDVRLVVAEDLASCERALASLQENERIEFQSWSAMVAPEAAPLIAGIAEATSSCPGVLRVEGHTDNMGVLDSNHILSLARAHAVRDALVARGVPLARFLIVGHGQDQPVATNNTADGRARNRRVEVRITFDAN